MQKTNYCVWQVDDLQLWLVTRVEEYCFATAGLLRTRAKARTQTLKN